MKGRERESIAMPLPKYVLIRSLYNNKYMTLRTGTEVYFEATDKSSPKTKFEVVPAGGLIHLKCCFSDYFICRMGPDSWKLGSKYRPQVEDTNNYRCTLLRPEFNGLTVRLRHVQLNNYLRVSDADDSNKNSLLAASAQPDNAQYSDVFVIDNWNLPRQWIGPSPSEGRRGRPFVFEVAVLTKIKIRSAHAVDAISFEGKSADGKAVVSPQYGGAGGNLSEIVLKPNEYLMSIKGTYDKFSGMVVVTSLEFITYGGRSYGPYGRQKGTSFTHNIDRKGKLAFHGRSSSLLDAIGIYIPR